MDSFNGLALTGIWSAGECLLTLESGEDKAEGEPLLVGVVEVDAGEVEPSVLLPLLVVLGVHPLVFDGPEHLGRELKDAVRVEAGLLLEELLEVLLMLLVTLVEVHHEVAWLALGLWAGEEGADQVALPAAAAAHVRHVHVTTVTVREGDGLGLRHGRLGHSTSRKGRLEVQGYHRHTSQGTTRSDK